MFMINNKEELKTDVSLLEYLNIAYLSFIGLLGKFIALKFYLNLKRCKELFLMGY